MSEPAPGIGVRRAGPGWRLSSRRGRNGVSGLRGAVTASPYAGDWLDWTGSCADFHIPLWWPYASDHLKDGNTRIRCLEAIRPYDISAILPHMTPLEKDSAGVLQLSGVSYARVLTDYAVDLSSTVNVAV